MSIGGPIRTSAARPRVGASGERVYRWSSASGRRFPGARSTAEDDSPGAARGVFADLIGIALSDEGYVIIDTGGTAALLVFLQRGADDLLSVQVLGTFKERGIDAVLVTEKVDGKDGLPQTAHMRLYSTNRLVEVGGVDWENSWVRRGALEAAQEIAAAIAQRSRLPGGATGEATSLTSQNAPGR